ncbi:hypothetical protein COX67_01090, partial [Candidatus Falkowbacteria bacterium CG_4_10_14_0_2_um_filter_36_22]
MKFTKKTKQKTDFGITVIIVIGLLVVINFFSYNLFFRWDLTQNNDYSISQVSKNTVKNLEDIVSVKVYFSENLPSDYIVLRQEVGDILDSYRNYSNGKIRVEFINPGEDENIKQELMMMGIPQVQFNVMEKDKYQVVNGYLGMAIKYGDQTEVIPVVQNIQDLEYQITLNIKKATKQINSVIGIVSSNLTSDINKEITIAYKKLQELYQMQTVDLTQASDIAADVNTLIIIGPKDKFADDQLKKLDAFLMRGGAMLILADGVKLGEGLAAEKN